MNYIYFTYTFKDNGNEYIYKNVCKTTSDIVDIERYILDLIEEVEVQDNDIYKPFELVHGRMICQLESGVDIVFNGYLTISQQDYEVLQNYL